MGRRDGEISNTHDQAAASFHQHFGIRWTEGDRFDYPTWDALDKRDPKIAALYFRTTSDA